MGKYKNVFKKILMWIFIILIFFSIVPLLINWIVITKNPLGLGFIYDHNREAWISFFGSLIGGLLTLVGVWWTIDDHKNEIALLNKPILTINEQSVKFKTLLGSEVLYVYLNIGNDGDSVAKEISIEFDEPNFSPSINNEEEYIKILTNNKISFIPSNREKKISLSIFKSNKESNKENKVGYELEPMNNLTEISIKGRITYSSSFDENNKYILKFSFLLIKIYKEKNSDWLLVNYNEANDYDNK